MAQDPNADKQGGGGLQAIIGNEFICRDGKGTTFQERIAGNKAVAIYFSAHWCPPCRGFTPKLAEYYKKSLKAKGMEVVFVSSDHSAEDFDKYYHDMPWLALPYEDRDQKSALSKKFKVKGIPSLIILDQDGSVITTDGRSKVMADPEGE